MLAADLGTSEGDSASGSIYPISADCIEARKLIRYKDWRRNCSAAAVDH